MRVEAPIAGSVEWRCEPGQRVSAGAVLAWLAGPGRCGLLPVTAPVAGVVSWRRSGLLPTLEAGDVCALLGDDGGARAAAEADERAALARELARLEAELAALRARPASHLSAALLAPQEAGLTARARALRAALSPSSR